MWIEVSNDEQQFLSSEYPRCSCAETWDHAVKCKATIQTRKNFAKELLLEMQKTKPGNTGSEEMFSFVEDVVSHFDGDGSEEHETHQGLIGIR